MTDKQRAPLAERLRASLDEGIEFARKGIDLQTTFVPVGRDYSGKEVIAIRERRQLSQAQFAKLLAVSIRTLQSWEQGLRKPSGPTMRLLQIFDEPDAFREVLIVRSSRRNYDEPKND